MSDPAPSTFNPANRYSTPQEPKPGGKRGLLLVSVFIVIGIAVAVGLKISRDVEHAQKIAAIDLLSEKALANYKADQIEEAAKFASQAKEELKAVDWEFDQAKRKGWEDTFQKIDELEKNLKDLDAVIAGADKDLPGTKDKLQSKRALYADGAQNKLLRDKIDLAMLDVEKKEQAAQVKKLDGELQEVNKIYAAGTIEKAGEEAKKLRTKLPANDTIKEKATADQLVKIRDRIEAVLGFARTYVEARQVRESARRDFNTALKSLGSLLTKLDAKTDDHKPLIAQIETFKKQVTDDQALQKRVKDDLKGLTGIARELAPLDSDIQLTEERSDAGVSFNYDGNPLKLTYDYTTNGGKALSVLNGKYLVRLEEPLLRKRPGAVLQQVVEIGKALKATNAPEGLSWVAVTQAPFPAARQALDSEMSGAEPERDGDKEIQFLYNNRLYTGHWKPVTPEERKLKETLNVAAENLAKAVEADKEIDEEVKPVVNTLIRGCIKELDYNDFLPGWFCRRAVNDRYLEDNVKGTEVRMKAQLDEYHKAFASFMQQRERFNGADANGNELIERISGENQKCFWSFAKKENRTLIGIENNCLEERPLLFVVYEYEGKQVELPKEPDVGALAVHMAHPALGLISSYDLKNKKLTYDPETWSHAALFTSGARIPEWMGPRPEWSFPPHVMLVDQSSDPKAIVTPEGRVDQKSYNEIKDKAEREKAQDAYLDQLAKVLNSTGYLHLYFVYFHQYVMDSPITTHPDLLGSGAHHGDIHQTVYETVSRELAGRSLGDCDDLAELYMSLTRRQNKLSYVMSVPAHATCGWVEKSGNYYKMQFLDTGPPRTFENEDLEKVVEIGSRSYDFQKTMHFDPKSLGFLFRFANEPTRTPYYLSARMFLDREYAEIMERVQSYWHFHFYALGIQTMEKKIADGDRVPENCVEVAGLYGRVNETEKSIKWTEEALKQLGQQDLLSRASETFRVGLMYKEAHNSKAAYDYVKAVVGELKKLSYPNREFLRYVSSRLSVSSLLTSIDRPWESWDLLKSDAKIFYDKRVMHLDHANNLTTTFLKMQDLIKEGKKLTTAEKAEMDVLDKMLGGFYQDRLFEADDGFDDYLRKYAFLGLFKGAREGREKLVAELLKKGPYPDPAANRDHMHRTSSAKDQEEDMKWVRLSLLSYALAVGDALDDDLPVEKLRKDEAIKLIEAMQDAANHAKKMGSLASYEFTLLTNQVIHSILTKNWKEFEDVMIEVERQDFARLTAEFAETFGKCARFCSPEDFETLYTIMSKHTTSISPYFCAVYEAYRAEGFEHARRGAKIALKRWPNDENMKREAVYLEELITARKKEKELREKTAKETPAPTTEAPKAPGEKSS